MTKKKTAVKKAVKKAAKRKAVKKAPAKKRAPAKKASAKKKAKKAVNAEARYTMIQDAAYYLAEKSGFSGCTLDHWIKAEKQIDAQLK
ncbi:MAG: DUF2934 domain-containing protein [Verrucomicrobia bacterium]|nr:DUF2934 domain-containing protein [Verrucomicrobiota bacterium]